MRSSGYLLFGVSPKGTPNQETHNQGQKGRRVARIVGRQIGETPTVSRSSENYSKSLSLNSLGLNQCLALTDNRMLARYYHSTVAVCNPCKSSDTIANPVCIHIDSIFALFMWQRSQMFQLEFFLFHVSAEPEFFKTVKPNINSLVQNRGRGGRAPILVRGAGRGA